MSCRKRRVAIACILIAAMCATCLPGMNVDATSTLDRLNAAQQEKKETEKEKEETEQEKQDAEKRLDGLASTKGNLQERLTALNNEMITAGEYLTKIQGQVAEQEEEIAQTRLELADSQAQERNQYAAMKKRMQFMYESQETAYLQMLLSADSIADLLNMSDYITMIAEYDRKQLEEYRTTVALVEETQSLLEAELKQMETLQQAAEDEQGRISQLMELTAQKVTEYADQIDNMEDQVNAMEEEIARQEEELAKQQQNIDTLRKLYEAELALSRLANQSVKRDISQVTFAEGDRYLLANLIYCEAGGEPYEGQVAVGAVVINRLLSSVYPDSVTGVIYQNRQFSPVANGKLALALAQNKATDACYQAADAAMSGYSNVGNCYYFRTPIEGLSGIQIGNHIFY